MRFAPGVARGIAVGLWILLSFSRCSLIFGETEECNTLCRHDQAVILLMILVPIARCLHPQAYKIQSTSGVSCVTPSASAYIYNQSTTAFAGTTVTGVVTLECRTPGQTNAWGKI